MITEFKIGFARTLNLGNYESARVEAMVTVVVGPEDDLAKVKEAAQAELNPLLKETYAAQYREKK